MSGRFLGVASSEASSVSYPLLVGVLAFVCAGLASAFVLSRRRWFFITLVAVGVLLAVYLATVQERPYTQQRIVQLLLPLVLLVVAVGWDRLVAVVARPSDVPTPGTRGERRALRMSRPRAAAAVGLVGASMFAMANALVDTELDLVDQAKLRHVGPEFAQAARWVDRVGGPNGREVIVLSGDFFSQLWITDALRNERDVAYASLHPSYQYQDSYWDGRGRRWLLVDRQAIRAVGKGMVVRRNDRFALLDLARGSRWWRYPPMCSARTPTSCCDP